MGIPHFSPLHANVFCEVGYNGSAKVVGSCVLPNLK